MAGTDGEEGWRLPRAVIDSQGSCSPVAGFADSSSVATGFP